MQIYYKAVYWAVIEVDNKESLDKALGLLKQGAGIDDLYADDDVYSSIVDNYVLQDTEELIVPTNGEVTIEVLENNKKIWSNESTI